MFDEVLAMEPPNFRNGLFTSTHPGVKPPERHGNRHVVLRLEAKSPGQSNIKISRCRKVDCSDAHCPARDLHNLSEIAELLKEHLQTTTVEDTQGLTCVRSRCCMEDASHASVKEKTKKCLCGSGDGFHGTDGPRTPRRKLVKKNQHGRDRDRTNPLPIKAIAGEADQELATEGKCNASLRRPY